MVVSSPCTSASLHAGRGRERETEAASRPQRHLVELLAQGPGCSRGRGCPRLHIHVELHLLLVRGVLVREVEQTLAVQAEVQLRHGLVLAPRR